MFVLRSPELKKYLVKIGKRGCISVDGRIYCATVFDSIEVFTKMPKTKITWEVVPVTSEELFKLRLKHTRPDPPADSYGLFLMDEYDQNVIWNGRAHWNSYRKENANRR